MTGDTYKEQLTKTKEIETVPEQDGMLVKLIYEIKEEIGTKVKTN